jgi:palmitoyltransferase ZDHHC9/14/18
MEPTTELREDVSLSVLSTAGSPTKQSVSGTPDSGNRRPTRSSRKSVATYNLQILAGTAIHTPTKYLETHHKKVLHGSLEDAVKTSPAATPTKRAPRFKQSPGDSSDAAEQQLVTEVAQAAQRRSSRGTDLRRQAALNLSGVGEAVANTIAGGKELVQRALKRSASDSRLRSSTQSAFPASPKRPRTAPKFETDEDEEDEEEQVQKVFVKPKLKQWMTQGLFVGQTRDFNARLSESQNRAKRKTRTVKENEVLPLPMFSYAAAMEMDPRTSNRDFKLPFDLFNPLPRRIKVEGWTKLSKSGLFILLIFKDSYN